jgi:hypothetical protein
MVAAPQRLAWLAGIALLLAGVPARLDAQTTEPPPQASEDRPIIRDSTVGYIDGAIPGDVLRFRFDSSYRNNQPSRGEFFYARSRPLGPGLPSGDAVKDDQEYQLYGEHLLGEHFSVFAEVPFRAADFRVNGNHSGPGDSNLGCKYALLTTEDTVGSFQFRTYVPTGAASRGLGNHHVSLEPSLLLYHNLSESLASESELRLWIPVGGTDFEGNLVRYGTGLRYNLVQGAGWTLAPVVELVGWTFLDGRKSAFPSGVVSSASGDTILNAKVGLRLRLEGFGDLYAGYGRCLTGDTFYKDIFRLELRWLY